MHYCQMSYKCLEMLNTDIHTDIYVYIYIYIYILYIYIYIYTLLKKRVFIFTNNNVINIEFVDRKPLINKLFRVKLVS